MNHQRTNEHGDTEYWTGEHWVSERWVCRHCLDEREAAGLPYRDSSTYHSFGIYAGKYCPTCWEQSGYVDAPASEFDPSYAGERLDDDY